MSDSHQEGSAPTRDLEETRDELTQASIALNTAYDRLQDLRASLRNFTEQRDRLSGVHTRPPNMESMGPDHSAIVLSDSDEESEVDFEFLRESLPTRLLELTSRWGHQHARLNAAARQAASPQSHQDTSTTVATTSSSEEPRPIYPPPRRRRPPPPAASSSRDGGMNTPPAASPARRSILEAHLRQMRHASNPSEPSTTLGRRVAQRAAAAAQTANSQHQPPETGTVAPSDTIIHSTLPLGLEPRPSTATFGYTSPQGTEPRAAAYLRHSLLPTPPTGLRIASARISTGGAAYSRFGDRAEHRPRTARSNSLTALTRGTPSSSQSNTSDVSTQTPLASRLGELRANMMPMSRDETARLSLGDTGDPLSASYRMRRRLNPRGEEQVSNINWSELMSEGERDEDLSDPAAWMRPPRQSTRVRSDRPRVQPEPETDDTVVHDPASATSREVRPIGRDSSAPRRRGWARLDADGDEISTEDEATLERARAESRLPRTRNWARGGTAWAAGRGSTVAVLDFVHHNSRDAATGHRDPNSPLDGIVDEAPTARQSQSDPHHILDSMFHLDSSTAYVSPLPVTLQDSGAHSQTQQYTKEVQVTMNGHMAGR